MEKNVHEKFNFTLNLYIYIYFTWSGYGTFTSTKYLNQLGTNNNTKKKTQKIKI